MPWLAKTDEPGGSFGNLGQFFWFRPDAAALADFNEITIPEGINWAAQRATFEKYGDDLMIVGAATENLVLTADWALWPMGMRAPTTAPDVALAAGPGITAEVICYQSWWDDRTQERSSLSAASVTLSAANQKINWQSFPTPLYGRATHIELWRSVDGSLPRVVMRRQIGVAAVVEAVAVGDLGEAFVEDFERFPRCRFGVSWHERQVMAGDDEHPDTLYLSLIGFGERYSGLNLRTKSRQPIVGLKVVNNQLIVLCPRAREEVSGFTEDDLSIEIVEPEVGAIGNWAACNVHSLLWIPTHLGRDVTDGSSSFQMADDVKDKWADEYELHRSAYENAWAVHDPVSKVVLLYVGTHSDTDANTFWVADYQPVAPQEGGGYGQPNWSYDVTDRAYHSGALLSVPGARRGDVYLGSTDGKILKANVSDEADDAVDARAKQLLLRTGADFAGDIGGDILHGKRFNYYEALVRAENNAWDLRLYAGDEYAYPADTAQFERTAIAASLAEDVGSGTTWQPKTTWPFTPPRLSGRALVSEITAASPVGMEFYGYAFAWIDGVGSRMPASIVPPE